MKGFAKINEKLFFQERVNSVKRLTSIFSRLIILVVVIAGCSSSNQKLSLDSKNKPLPDYVLNSSPKVQETYIMASKYPQVLAQVPCFCGCGTQDGHKSNLQCYIDKMGPNHAVEQWDPMSIS